ncbi:MAG: hypothetical protein DRI01_07605, partial [Chloroflexi bacterium]
DAQIATRVSELRKLYANRMIIPDKLYELYKLGQKITREHEDETLPYDDPKVKQVSDNLMKGGFFDGTKLFTDIASSSTFQQMKRYAEKADSLKAFQSINRVLIFIRRGMIAENIGIDRYLKNNSKYQELLDEISKLASPLPTTTSNKITEAIEIIEGINTLNLIDFSNVDANPAIKIMMQAQDQSAEFILKRILNDIAREIEKFLAVQNGNRGKMT